MFFELIKVMDIITELCTLFPLHTLCMRNKRKMHQPVQFVKQCIIYSRRFHYHFSQYIALFEKGSEKLRPQLISIFYHRFWQTLFTYSDQNSRFSEKINKEVRNRNECSILSCYYIFRWDEHMSRTYENVIYQSITLGAFSPFECFLNHRL